MTTSDIFRRILGIGSDPNKVKVFEIMTPMPLITVNPDASCNEAVRLMIEHSIRRLLVVGSGYLVGIITSKDIRKCLEATIDSHSLFR